MSATHTTHTEEAARLTVRLLDELGFAGGDAGGRVGVRLWNGALWPAAASGDG